MFLPRRRHRPSVPYSTTSSASAVVFKSDAIASSSKSRDESSCLTWFNVVLGALIPLMIGIATVVITVQQQKNEAERRNQDLQIARDDREQSQRQADELYLQDVYKTYIQDVSTTLFKEQENGNFSIIEKQAKLAYIRSQTLTALEELDPQRRTRVFQFLYENNLLPRISSSNENDVSVVLSGANMANITLCGMRSNRLQFKKLSLSAVDLTNSSFIGCDFIDGVDFRNSDMNNVRFDTSDFRCRKVYDDVDGPLQETSAFFNDATLIRAEFRATELCDISFNEAKMSYSNFSRARFWGRLDIIGTDLRCADFSDSRILAPVFVTIQNTNMLGAWLDNSAFEKAKIEGRLYMTNVILPNGTWIVNDMNIIVNGNAEENCSTDFIPHWSKFSSATTTYPIVSTNVYKFNSSTFGNCYFNLTVGNNSKDVAMYQDSDIKDFSMLIDTNETEYQLSSDVMCASGLLVFDVLFFDENLTRLHSTRLIFNVNDTQVFNWHSISTADLIQVTSRTIEVQVTVTDQGSCYVDNIELRIARRKAKE